MHRFEAVIFDMDGVLIDSEPIHFLVLEQLLARDGFALSRTENDDFIGATSEAMFRTLRQRHHLPRSLAEYLALYDEEIVRAFDTPRPLQPGVTRLMQWLRGHGKRTAVASSSRRVWIDATLRSLGLSEAFDVIVSGDDVQHGKPDPEIYRLAATRLRIRPEACLAIEDSPSGVVSARGARMAVLGVRTPYTAHLVLDGVLKTVDSLDELDLPAD
jgi:HAD superfamily hydrolase (TIGR01509 family)